MNEEIDIQDEDKLIDIDDSEVTKQKVAEDEDIVEVVKDEEKAETKGKKFARVNDEEVTDDELKEYSDDVQKRIKKLTWAKSNERRGREQAEKDRDEAVRIATILLEEKKKADQARGVAEDLSNKSVTERIDIALVSAKRKLKEAAETFDAEAMAEASTELAQLAVQKERLKDFKPNTEKSTRQEEQTRVESRQTAQTVSRPDPLAEAWARRNPWFQLDSYGRAGNEETGFALKVHETLLGSGVHPTLDASEYYRKLDATMRANFPDHFADTPRGNTEKRTARPASTVVSGVTRSTNGTTKVRLTESQLRIAKTLGVSPEDYAKSLAELRS